MSNEEILTKAIEKAVKKGWKVFPLVRGYSFYYDHDFAKAFFGDVWTDEEMESNKFPTIDLEPWQYHLQQMVISQDPIQYLAKYL